MYVWVCVCVYVCTCAHIMLLRSHLGAGGWLASLGLVFDVCDGGRGGGGQGVGLETRKSRLGEGGLRTEQELAEGQQVVRSRGQRLRGGFEVARVEIPECKWGSEEVVGCLIMDVRKRQS